MWRLADALGVTIGTLVGDDSESASHILRRDDVPDFVSASGLHARILSVARSEHRTELLELIFDEALAHTSNAHTAGTEELLICIEGAIEAGPDGDLTLVRQGDVFWFPADRPHQYVATEPSRGILMMVYPATLTPILGRSPNGSIAQSSFWEPLPVTRARSK
jgi:quercetin dioxygenase-like cupin family protein